MFPEPTELLLVGCSIESIWTPKSKSNTLTPRINSQTYWQREILHVMNGIIFRVCSTSAISVPPIVLKWCRKERKKMQVKKESQQNRSRWRIWSRDTAQGIQTCLLLLHQKAGRKPNLKVKYLWARGMSSNQERRDLWWALVHQTTQNGYSRKSGLLKNWKSGENVGSRNGETCEWTTSRFIDDDDIDTNTATESDLSLKSRSFLHRVNDRVQKVLDQSSKDAMQDSNKHSLVWWICMSSTLEASVFIGKNYSEILHSIKITGNNLTMKQMFDISENQMRFLEWLQLTGKILHGNNYLWSLMKKSSVSLSHAKVFVFSDSVICLGMVNQNPTWNSAWEEKLSWFKSLSQYRILDTMDGEPIESEWNVFQDSPHCSSATKSKSSCLKWAVHQNLKRITFMTMLNDILWGSEDTERECNANADLVSTYARRFPAGRLSFLGPGSEKKWYSTRIDRPQGEWDRVAESMMIRFEESGHPVSRATSPLSRAKEVENYQYTSVLMEKRLNMFFTQLFLLISSVSTEQSQICVMNTESAQQERRDLCWQNDLTHCLSQQVCWWKQLHFRPNILHKKIYCKSTKNDWKGCHNKIVWLKFVLMQDSWQQLESDSTSRQRTLKSSHNLQNQWHVVSEFCKELKNHLTRKVGFEGVPKLGPC